jgi:hypothetical protein
MGGRDPANSCRNSDKMPVCKHHQKSFQASRLDCRHRRGVEAAFPVYLRNNKLVRIAERVRSSISVMSR